MSVRDRKLLKQAGLTQTYIAKLLDVSSQAISCGVCASHDYLTTDRLKKIANHLDPKQLDKLINGLSPEEVDELFNPCISVTDIRKRLYNGMLMRDYTATTLMAYFLDKEPNPYEPKYYENAIRQAYTVADAMEKISEETLTQNEC